MASIVDNLLNIGSEILEKRLQEEQENNINNQNQDIGIKEPKKKRKKNKNKVEEDPNKNHIFEENKPYTYEEICEKDLKDALELNKENPTFDFRNLYTNGDLIYYVLKTDRFIKKKEIITLKIRNIYPRMIIGVQEAGYCECIGYKQRDMIFVNYVDAKNYYDTLNDYIEESLLKKSSSKEDE